jgi:hypothetical protein
MILPCAVLSVRTKLRTRGARGAFHRVLAAHVEA